MCFHVLCMCDCFQYLKFAGSITGLHRFKSLHLCAVTVCSQCVGLRRKSCSFLPANIFWYIWDIFVISVSKLYCLVSSPSHLAVRFLEKGLRAVCWYPKKRDCKFCLWEVNQPCHYHGGLCQGRAFLIILPWWKPFTFLLIAQINWHIITKQVIFCSFIFYGFVECWPLAQSAVVHVWPISAGNDVPNKKGLSHNNIAQFSK